MVRRINSEVLYQLYYSATIDIKWFITFCPLMMRSSPFLTAVVFRLATSEPPPGVKM